MKKRRPTDSIDGFIVRRPSQSSLGTAADMERRAATMRRRQAQTLPKPVSQQTSRPLHTDAHGNTLTTSIKDSLAAIDNETPDEAKAPKRRWWQRRRKQKKQLSRRQKIIRRIVIVLVVLLLVAIGYIAYRVLSNTSRIFGGNIFDLIQEQPLKMDSNGRSNIVVVGTTDDDPTRDGADLTDSMMVLSIDQNKKDAYMMSIPRDLYVDYGRACPSGYAGKINAYFSCIDSGTSEAAETRRMDGLRSFTGKILGMDIQYAVHVNSLVIRDAVKAVDGVTIKIESRDPRGVMDSNFDWKCGANDPNVSYAERLKRCPPNGHYIDFKNGNVNLSGEKALWFTRARGSQAPTYGFEESNFDREKNQQKVLVALTEKATSTGTLTNAGKVLGLMEAMGNNLRTNFVTKEIRTLMRVGSQIDTKAIQRLSFIDQEPPLLTNGNIPGAGSVVVPTAGQTNYSAIQAFIRKKLSDDPVVKEEAKVVVLNGNGPAGQARIEADKLEKQNLSVVQIANAPNGEYGRYRVYQVGKGASKSATKARLEKIYGVTVTTEAPSFGVGTEADFIVVIGTGATSN